MNLTKKADPGTGWFSVWLCYGVEPNRMVAMVPPGYHFPCALIVAVESLDGDPVDNRAAGLRGELCNLEVFVRDDELTSLQGRGHRVFYTFDRMSRRTLTPRERADLQ